MDRLNNQYVIKVSVRKLNKTNIVKKFTLHVLKIKEIFDTI